MKTNIRIPIIITIAVIGIQLVFGHSERFAIEVEHRLQTVVVETQGVGRIAVHILL